MLQTPYLDDCQLKEITPINDTSYLITYHSPNLQKRVSLPMMGQFYMIQLPQFLLRRPLGLFNFDSTLGTIQFYYKEVGEGTKALTKSPIDTIHNIQGPLGQGFKVNSSAKRSIVIGGGMGIAPLKLLLDELTQTNQEIVFIASGRSASDIAILPYMNIADKVYCIETTDDGTKGLKMNAVQAFQTLTLTSDDQLYACGPDPMLNALLPLVKQHNIQAQFSLEAHMACGVKACVGCSLETKDGMKKICFDGPVFDAQKLIKL